MKTILILVLVVLLLTACVPEEEIDQSLLDSSCQRISYSARVCELWLADGTHCAVSYTGSNDGGTAMTCNWQ